MVGEIGISRREFLYELKAWEINAIIRGYDRRLHTPWETARFLAFCTAKSSMGGSSIHHFHDLIRFPWESGSDMQEISDEEIEETRERLRQENENADSK